MFQRKLLNLSTLSVTCHIIKCILVKSFFGFFDLMFFQNMYRNINNGVYRAGFATSQEAYDVAVRDVFNALDKVN